MPFKPYTTNPLDLVPLKMALEANETACPVPDLVNVRNISGIVNLIQSGFNWGSLPDNDTNHLNSECWLRHLIAILSNLGNYQMGEGVLTSTTIARCTTHMTQSNAVMRTPERWPPLHYYSYPGRYSHDFSRNIMGQIGYATRIRDFLLTMCRWETLLPDPTLLVYSGAVFTQMAALPPVPSRYVPASALLLTGAYG